MAPLGSRVTQTGVGRRLLPSGLAAATASLRIGPQIHRGGARKLNAEPFTHERLAEELRVEDAVGCPESRCPLMRPPPLL